VELVAGKTPAVAPSICPRISPALAHWSVGLALLIGLAALFTELTKIRAPKGALVGTRRFA